MAIGAPQPVQKNRSAYFESTKVFKVDVCVRVSASLSTSTNGRKPDPETCWHARQWQSVISDGAAVEIYWTPPQRHPPSKTIFSLDDFATYLEPSAADDCQLKPFRLLGNTYVCVQLRERPNRPLLPFRSQPIAPILLCRFPGLCVLYHCWRTSSRHLLR